MPDMIASSASRNSVRCNGLDGTKVDKSCRPCRRRSGLEHAASDRRATCPIVQAIKAEPATGKCRPPNQTARHDFRASKHASKRMGPRLRSVIAGAHRPKANCTAPRDNDEQAECCRNARYSYFGSDVSARFPSGPSLGGLAFPRRSSRCRLRRITSAFFRAFCSGSSAV
jgi:hypothetical protein